MSILLFFFDRGDSTRNHRGRALLALGRGAILLGFVGGIYLIVVLSRPTPGFFTMVEGELTFGEFLTAALIGFFVSSYGVLCTVVAKTYQALRSAAHKTEEDRDVKPATDRDDRENPVTYRRRHRSDTAIVVLGFVCPPVGHLLGALGCVVRPLAVVTIVFFLVMLSKTASGLLGGMGFGEASLTFGEFLASVMAGLAVLSYGLLIDLVAGVYEHVLDASAPPSRATSKV